MRFVSFQYHGQFPPAGAVLGAAVIDLAAAAPLAFEVTEGQRWELLDILRGAPEGIPTPSGRHPQRGRSGDDRRHSIRPIVTELVANATGLRISAYLA